MNAMADQSELKESNVRKKPSSSQTYKYLLAATLVSLIISTFASFFFYRKWYEAEDRYISLLNDKNALTHNYALLKNSFDDLYSDLTIMRDAKMKVITLQPSDSTKKYSARIYWNPVTRETCLDAIALPEADSTTQFQLWALTGGQYVYAGAFEPSPEEGILRLIPVVNADSWAVSIEPKSGSSVPTMDKICLKSINESENQKMKSR
jgi:hypothetical protein